MNGANRRGAGNPIYWAPRNERRDDSTTTDARAHRTYSYMNGAPDERLLSLRRQGPPPKTTYSTIPAFPDRPDGAPPIPSRDTAAYQRARASVAKTRRLEPPNQQPPPRGNLQGVPPNGKPPWPSVGFNEAVAIERPSAIKAAPIVGIGAIKRSGSTLRCEFTLLVSNDESMKERVSRTRQMCGPSIRGA
jgi:hypothetical protein